MVEIAVVDATRTIPPYVSMATVVERIALTHTLRSIPLHNVENKKKLWGSQDLLLRVCHCNITV
jgi:hypothetical protein